MPYYNLSLHRSRGMKTFKFLKKEEFSFVKSVKAVKVVCE